MWQQIKKGFGFAWTIGNRRVELHRFDIGKWIVHCYVDNQRVIIPTCGVVPIDDAKRWATNWINGV